MFGRTPDLVAADAGFYSAANEKKLEEMGVKRVSVPNRNTKSVARRQKQKQRWFKHGQRWRTGCEGRISVLKRRHGLDRCRYRGSCRNESLGRTRRHRRQPDQHRPGAGDAGGRGMTNRHPSTKLVRSVILSLFTRLPKVTRRYIAVSS